MERKKQRNHCYCYTIRLINRSKLYCRTVSAFLFFLLSISSLFFTTTATTGSSSSTITCLDTSRCPMLAKADIKFQESKEIKHGIMVHDEDKTDYEFSMPWGRRLLGGPGSSPPRCASKCGKCTPCKAVHVPVPPGTPVTAEYYPEAWRCKCGNKLYMP